MPFKKASWIWLNKAPVPNEFADFTDTFTYASGKVILRLSAETDYIVYLNGKRILYCQFASYKNKKYYEEEDITECCLQGENTLLITVRYEGIESACHINCGAGLIYSVECDGTQIAYSSEATLGSISNRYIQGLKRNITVQLGLTVGMSARGNAHVMSPCRIAELPYSFVRRPVKHFEDLAPLSGKLLDIPGRRIYDLGREEAGYVYLNVKCASDTDVRIAYGEHIQNARVDYIIGHRDFSLDFECVAGENRFENMFLRMGGRYLEVIADTSAEVLDIGIIPVLYPLTEKPCHLKGLDRQIYDVSVRTLRLCMHTHYEDCPWREQALYVIDSRNQMLCGYYAFEETEFQRENLLFMSNGVREDGMLELTYPAINTPAIPFFSVMYPVAVCEYVDHTGDTSLIREVMPTITGIMDRLYSWIDGKGLIKNQGAPYWNFYEWSHGSNGHEEFGVEGAYDLMINCAFVYSCEHIKRLCSICGYPLPKYDTESMRSAIVETFFDESTGIFTSSTVNGVRNVLGNTFAILIGLGDDRTYRAIRGEKNSPELVPITLSMKCYLYDAILSRDKNGKNLVLDDLRTTYSYMLSKGATSFWETLTSIDEVSEGWSLCHGWSALPVYYFNKLL